MLLRWALPMQGGCWMGRRPNLLRDSLIPNTANIYKDLCWAHGARTITTYIYLDRAYFFESNNAKMRKRHCSMQKKHNANVTDYIILYYLWVKSLCKVINCLRCIWVPFDIFCYFRCRVSIRLSLPWIWKVNMSMRVKRYMNKIIKVCLFMWKLKKKEDKCMPRSVFPRGGG